MSFLLFVLLYWRRAWQPTPLFLPGESHVQRRLVGYSLWGRKELDLSEVVEHAHNYCINIFKMSISMPELCQLQLWQK